MTETRFEVDGTPYSAVPTSDLDTLKTVVATTLANPTNLPVAKRTFTAEQRREMAAKGQAMRDGSYPIANAQDLRNAIQALGRGNTSTAAVKAHIIRRAKALNLTNLLPDDWNVQKAADALTAELLESLLTDRVAKHGRHDQKTHGRRARAHMSRVSARSAERRNNRADERSLASRHIVVGKHERTGDNLHETIATRRGATVGTANYHTAPGGFVVVTRVKLTDHAKPGDGGRLLQSVVQERSKGKYRVQDFHLETKSPQAKKAYDEWKARPARQRRPPPRRSSAGARVGKLVADQVKGMSTEQKVALINEIGTLVLGGTRAAMAKSVASSIEAALLAELTTSLPVVKSEPHRRFTLAPLYIPDRLDAHAEHTDAETLQKAVWGLIRKGDRSLRLQHDTSITAGEIVEVVSWPYPVEATLSTPDSVAKSSRTVTLPPGTVYLGTIWEPWAWKMVLDGKVRGYSMGGTAKRIEVDLPSPKAA